MEKDDFWLGEGLVQPSLNRIRLNEVVYQMEPRVMRVLLCLAEQQGNVVSRDALLNVVWQDVVVTDDPLNRAISELRKVFGDTPRDPTYIETIRTVGYRLIAPVKPASATKTAAPVGRSPVSEGTRTSPSETNRSQKHDRGRGKSVSLTALLVIALLIIAAFITYDRFAGAPPAPSPTVYQPVPLTSLPGIEMTPALSPDGSRIAFSWNGESRARFDIYVRQLTGDLPLRLTRNDADDSHPAWSPDGQRLAFIRSRDNSCGIFSISAMGGQSRKMTDCNEAQDLSWSPDGTLLVYSDTPSPSAPHAVFSVSTETSEPGQHTFPDASINGDVSPAFSPDGAALAFIRSHTTGLDQIGITSLGDDVIRWISSGHQRIQGLRWPDSNTLIFASDWSGQFSLYRHDLDNGGRTWLLTGGDGVLHPTSDHTLDALIYEEWRWDKNIWRIPVNNGEGQDRAGQAEAFLTSTRWDRGPAISPDGDRIAYVSNQSGSYEIWLFEASTNRQFAVTHFGGPNVSRPRWSPDGHSLAFDVRANGNADIHVLRVEEGLSARITSSPSIDINPAWTADGKGLYFTSNRSGAWEIWQTADETGAGPAEQVTRNGGYAAQVSPDREWLYFMKRNQPGLWRQRIPGARGAEDSESLVVPWLRPGDWGNWAVTERGLYAVHRGSPLHRSPADAEPAGRLVFYDLAAGSTSTLYRPEKPVANPGLAVAPDHSYLLFVQMDHSEADLMRAERIPASE